MDGDELIIWIMIIGIMWERYRTRALISFASMCDANYIFTAVDIEAYRSQSYPDEGQSKKHCRRVLLSSIRMNSEIAVAVVNTTVILHRVIIGDSLQLAGKYRLRKTEDVCLEISLESVVEICEPIPPRILNVCAMSLINFEIINNIYWLWRSCTHSTLGVCQRREDTVYGLSIRKSDCLGLVTQAQFVSILGRRNKQIKQTNPEKKSSKEIQQANQQQQQANPTNLKQTNKRRRSHKRSRKRWSAPKK
uniref:Uncharacterized protein n=1 Tax=Glossina austeni TaxID=7395 RepID=A0A1A9UDE8_GLOAU